MTTRIGYLDALDRLLILGLGSLSRAFIDKQCAFAGARQLPNGGFQGRQGAADLYYADFGVRLSSLLSPNPSALTSAARWASQQQSEPRDVVTAFNLLNIDRMLRLHNLESSVDRRRIGSVIQAQQLTGGGFSRSGGAEVSAYNTFLAALCFEMMETEHPDPNGAIRAVRGLKRRDGCYGESTGWSEGQTNATAAAVAFLTMYNALPAEDSESAARFLATMQSPEGGIPAQLSAPEDDLLSTFTAVLTLFGLNQLERLNLPSIARFVGSLACVEGGFRACLSDDEPDIEYTYYGIGTMALLRTFVLAREQNDTLSPGLFE